MYAMRQAIQFQLQIEGARTDPFKRETISVHKRRLHEKISLKNRYAAAWGQARRKI